MHYLIAGSVVPLALLVETTKVYNNATAIAADCGAPGGASRERRGGDADAVVSDGCDNATRVRRGGDAAADYVVVQSGESVLVFLGALLAILIVSWLVDLFSAPSDETLEELNDFHIAQKMMIASKTSSTSAHAHGTGTLNASGMDAGAASAFKIAAEQSQNRGIRGGGKPVCLKSRKPLSAENLLEDTDGFLRPL